VLCTLTMDDHASSTGELRYPLGGEPVLGPDGAVLGRHGRAYLRHDGPEHVMCFAPTRSGKGVGLVVPSLLT